MLNRLPDFLYSKITGQMPEYTQASISTKPNDWDLCQMESIWKENTNIFMIDLIKTYSAKITPFERKKMMKKHGEAKADLARVKHMRNKLKHKV